MLWSHNNKNQYFCNIIKSRCGSGRVGANTHYHPALVIGAKILPCPCPATSMEWVKFVWGRAVQVGSGRVGAKLLSLTMRVTLIAWRMIKRPVKFTIYPSEFSRSSKKMNVWVNPILTVNIAKKKMTMPRSMCHGRSAALAVHSAPGEQ